MNLTRANRWTNSYRIVNILSERTHNEKTCIGFYKETDVPRDLCYISGNLRHPTTKCPVAAKRGLEVQI